jgi:hypothetical protein
MKINMCFELEGIPFTLPVIITDDSTLTSLSVEMDGRILSQDKDLIAVDCFNVFLNIFTHYFSHRGRWYGLNFVYTPEGIVQSAIVQEFFKVLKKTSSKCKKVYRP